MDIRPRHMTPADYRELITGPVVIPDPLHRGHYYVGTAEVIQDEVDRMTATECLNADIADALRCDNCGDETGECGCDR